MMDNGTHGTPLNVALAFAKVTEGANAGKWAATVRLLGVAGFRLAFFTQAFRYAIREQLGNLLCIRA